MMSNVELIQSILGCARTGRDHPQMVATLKNAGVCGYSVHVASGETVIYTNGHETIRLPGCGEEHLVSFHPDVGLLSDALSLHHEGRTDYITFCRQAAKAGLNLWVVDLNMMNVSYFTINGLLVHEESIQP